MEKAIIEFIKNGDEIQGTMCGGTVELLSLLLDGINHLYKKSSPSIREGLKHVITEAIIQEKSPVWSLEDEEGETSVSFVV